MRKRERSIHCCLKDVLMQKKYAKHFVHWNLYKYFKQRWCEKVFFLSWQEGIATLFLCLVPLSPEVWDLSAVRTYTGGFWCTLHKMDVMVKVPSTFFLYQYIFETTVWKGFSSWVDKRELLHLRSFFMGFHVVKRMLEGYTIYQVMIVFLSPFLCQDKIKNQCQAILTEFDILHNWLKGKKLF